MKCDVWKPCSDQRWQDELRFFYLKIFWAIFLIYCVADQQSITRSRRSVLTSSYQFSLFWGQWAAQCAMSKNCAKKKKNSTPIYVKCDKMYWSKVCVQSFWYCVPGLDIQPELSEIDNPARRKAVAGYGTLQVIWRVIYHFFQHCIFFSTIFTLSLHPPNPEP